MLGPSPASTSVSSPSPAPAYASASALRVSPPRYFHSSSRLLADASASSSAPTPSDSASASASASKGEEGGAPAQAPESVGEEDIVDETYDPVVRRYLHWFMAIGIIGCIIFVKLAQSSKKNEDKGYYMKYHKTFGLIMAAAIVPRVGYAIFSRAPTMLPAPSIQQTAAKVSHFALYGFMCFMPITGITMGYFGGKGLPFFNWVIPGKATPDGSIAGPAYKSHKFVGQFLPYVIPIHVGGALVHAAKGQKIFRRINPFV
eukprot:TRINITY_DN704_c1_g1_i2.p1 TRINITY_DN704_c1_g1~~TRINITY_DN704_c1_g1_i2.p1  ORF type:complete len:296 (+),score=92.07 TRINITY_DN704_c1_g1_i2:113-889(+)